jgi:dihydroorotate dehydrogenase
MAICRSQLLHRFIAVIQPKKVSYLYKFIKSLLFALDAEKAHDITLGVLGGVSRSNFLSQILQSGIGNRVPDIPTRLMGLEFRHPVGLAAGLDKNARAYEAFSALGFSSIETGTVTPKPQPGSEKPRIFRLVQDQAIINRLGFNSDGLDNYKSNLQKRRTKSIIGGNIGKNASTSLDRAHEDYVTGMRQIYKLVDYITINISSPNTKALRELQNAEYLDNLLFKVKDTQSKLNKVSGIYTPVALKIAPDLQPDELETLCELATSHEFDALIATNTTIDRPTTLASEQKTEIGGLSGKPLNDQSTDTIRTAAFYLEGKLPIIGVGGITNTRDAWDKLMAGAEYLQIYTSFIYQGPAIIETIVKGLQTRLEHYQCQTIAEARRKLTKDQ